MITAGPRPLLIVGPRYHDTRGDDLQVRILRGAGRRCCCCGAACFYVAQVVVVVVVAPPVVPHTVHVAQGVAMLVVVAPATMLLYVIM